MSSHSFLRHAPDPVARSLAPAGRGSLPRRLVGLLLAAVVASGLSLAPVGVERADAATLTSTQLTTVAQVAAAQVGVRYRWGGTTPQTGFDCSGYVLYAYGRAHKVVPRTAQQQYLASTVIPGRSARAGDLVFFHSSAAQVYHVGIYAGAGYVWHAPKPGKRVAKVKIWTTAVSYGRAR